MPTGSGYGHEAIPCRRLIIHLFHSLASVGWHIHVSADLSKKEYDKDTLFFRAGPPVQRYYCSVSFNQSDKIRMIDSPNQAVLEAFKSVVGVSTKTNRHLLLLLLLLLPLPSLCYQNEWK